MRHLNCQRNIPMSLCFLIKHLYELNGSEMLKFTLLVCDISLPQAVIGINWKY